MSSLNLENDIDKKLKDYEIALKDWFNVELPRLVSGLPITEDSPIITKYSDLRYSSPSLLEATSGDLDVDFQGFHKYTDRNLPILTSLTSDLGLNNTYALAEALCACQAKLAVHEVKVMAMTTKTLDLNARNTKLRGLLSTYQQDIDYIACVRSSLISNLESKSNSDEDPDSILPNVAVITGDLIQQSLPYIKFV